MGTKWADPKWARLDIGDLAMDLHSRTRNILEGVEKLRCMLLKDFGVNRLLNALKWFCSECGCVLAGYARYSEEGVGKILWVDSSGKRLGGRLLPDLGVFTPSEGYSDFDHIFIDPKPVDLSPTIKRQYYIYKPVKRVFFRLPYSTDKKDFLCLVFTESPGPDKNALETMSVPVTCFSCLTELHRTDLERKQREFLMHLYEGAIPGLESAHKRVLEAATDLLKCKRYALWAVNHRTKSCSMLGEKGFTSPEFPRILQLQEAFVGLGVERKVPFLISDVFSSEYKDLKKMPSQELRAKVIVPVLGSAESLGNGSVTHVLVMYASDPDYEFEKELFRAASERISVYLTNAVVAEQQRIVQLLLQCSAKATDLQDYLGQVVSVICDIVNVQGCSIFYYSEVWEKLLLGATSGLVRDPNPMTVMYDLCENSATVRCFTEDRNIVYDDIQGRDKHKFKSKYVEKSTTKAQTFAAVPIRKPSGTITGVIRCINKLVPRSKKVDYFHTVDVELIDFIGRLVGYHLELRVQDRQLKEVLDRTMHEVYSPASAIRITAETIRSDIFDMPTAQIDSMLENVEEYAKLLDWLAESVTYFTLSKPQRLKKYNKVSFYLGSLLKEVQALARPIAKSRGRRFHSLKFGFDDSKVKFDRECLIIILVNLVGNAIKYFDPRKCEKFEVIADARIWDDFESDASGKVYPQALIIKVSDWGIGVSSLDAARIFDPGFRASNALAVDDTGQGLGLSLIKMIVEDQGGEVYMESNANPTVFTVIIPQKGRSR